MKGWIGGALVAAVMVCASVGAVSTAAAASQQTVKTDAGKATDFSARRAYRRYPRYLRYYRYPHRSYEGFYYRPYPSYYGRPNYYRPYPYYAPYAYGFRYGPLWW